MNYKNDFHDEERKENDGRSLTRLSEFSKINKLHEHLNEKETQSKKILTLEKLKERLDGQI